MKHKAQLWYYNIMSILTAVTVVMGLTIGTRASRPYEERTYFLVLAILALLVCFKSLEWAKEEKAKVKDKKTTDEEWLKSIGMEEKK